MTTPKQVESSNVMPVNIIIRRNSKRKLMLFKNLTFSVMLINSSSQCEYYLINNSFRL